MNQQQYPPQQPFGQAPFSPPPPKKVGAGKVVGLGCLGLVGLFVLIALVGAVVGGGAGSSKGAKAGGSVSKGDKAADASAAAASGGNGEEGDGKNKAGKKVVVFKVWGTAPAGALGPLDITYGSDSDSRDGAFKNGEFEATLPVDDEAVYFNVTAQLQGSGDIHCSVTVGGKTKKAHASGDYNICSAQLSSGLLGGWG
ncbi:hypothetical protein ABZ896_00945 [Streptomyces sp. NPDC047072]|uniref:hypothetical protein n=1 Tax=Streptomyces sp. NPDC047072 TaxID=3154809 RepID=UPI0033CEBEAD